MATVTSERLKQLAPKIRPELALVYAEALEAALSFADLNKPLRIRHFMAQIAHESGSFRSLTESTAYKDPHRLDVLFKNVQGLAHAQRLIADGPQAIANTIYANKLGNGGPASGDGFRFRGRGFMMITGRSNYRQLGKLTGMPLEDEPELLGDAGPAAEAAARFWDARRINLAADKNDVGAVTALVNGPAKLHLAERAALLAKAATIWK
jgi:putative chitinase